MRPVIATSTTKSGHVAGSSAPREVDSVWSSRRVIRCVCAISNSEQKKTEIKQKNKTFNEACI